MNVDDPSDLADSRKDGVIIVRNQLLKDFGADMNSLTKEPWLDMLIKCDCVKVTCDDIAKKLTDMLSVSSVELGNVFLNSFYVAFISSIIITITAFFILCVKRYTNSNNIKIITSFLSTGYAIPGAVIGLSVMLIIQYLNPNINFLMGTISLLIYAYIFRFIAVAIFPLESSFQQQPMEFDQLGKTLNLTTLDLSLIHISEPTRPY